VINYLSKVNEEKPIGIVQNIQTIKICEQDNCLFSKFQHQQQIAYIKIE